MILKSLRKLIMMMWSNSDPDHDERNLDCFVVRFDKHLRQYWHPGQGRPHMDSFNILQPGGDGNDGNGCDGYGDGSYSEYGEEVQNKLQINRWLKVRWWRFQFVSVLRKI